MQQQLTKVGRPAAEGKPSEPAARAPGKLITSEEQLNDLIEADVSSPDAVAGVLVTAKTGPDHRAPAVVPDTVNAIFRRSAQADTYGRQ
ncbi:MAG: hypothetical protein J5I65_08825 [Aridibacter famidurans]|nr:hypothetical protein [Aridibacter famidurans]